MDKVFILVGDTDYGITTRAFSNRVKAMAGLQKSLDEDSDIQYTVREFELPPLTAQAYIDGALDHYDCEAAYWINELVVDEEVCDGCPHY